MCKLNLTPFTPCPLFPLSKLERGPGGEVVEKFLRIYRVYFPKKPINNKSITFAAS